MRANIIPVYSDDGRNSTAVALSPVWMMGVSEIENIEVDLFLEAVYRRYGYDFRDYARASIDRRVHRLLTISGAETISDMIVRVMHEDDFISEIVSIFSITVTEMFRDAAFYKGLREKVVPFLKTYPYIKIWHAGCASGEEAYSLAILLKEEGLYDRATIFATDINDTALTQAKSGVYSIEDIRKSTENYQKSGGRKSLSDYYHAEYDAVIMSRELKKNITFANHNLVIDGVFSEIHLVLCRNVVIYFNKVLQERVYRLFEESLVYGGFLCLGMKESLDFSGVRAQFMDIDSGLRIFTKKSEVS